MRSVIHLTGAVLFATFAHAHEGFLTPHLHSSHAGHGHAHHHDHGHASHDGTTTAHHLHDHSAESRFHITTGVRYTRFDLRPGDAGFLETGLGITYQATPSLGLSVEGRYGWFDGDLGRADGWLPPRAGLNFHIPLADQWELGVGIKTQFPGTAPLGTREWELSSEIEIRYDRGSWYAGLAAEVTWVIGGGHRHDHPESHAHEPDENHEDEGEYASELHDGEPHGGTDATHDADEDHDEHTVAGHDELAEIHDIIDSHAESEFNWQLTFGIRLLDKRLTLEGRAGATHVIDGDTDDWHYVRYGARAIYHLNERTAIIVNASAPIGHARRDEWQTGIAVRIGF